VARKGQTIWWKVPALLVLREVMVAGSQKVCPPSGTGA